MILLIGSLIYAMVALAAARLIAGHFAWTMYLNDRSRYPALYRDRTRRVPNGEQWFGAWCGAVAIAVLWPFVLLPWFIGRRGYKVGAERQAEIEARERKVAEMERELGIR
jgi:hypothetical protein